jgi:hypothetical protein
VKNITIEWKNGSPKGKLEIADGKFEKLVILRGQGTITGESFAFTSHGSCGLNVSIKEHNLNFGSGATIITVRTVANPFSFFLRDVSKEYPIFVPDYGVIITDADDKRSYEQIEDAIRNCGLKTKLQQIQNEEEESYEEAAANTRKLRCPTWLGVSRDIRIFELDFRTGFSRGSMVRWFHFPSPTIIPFVTNFLSGAASGVSKTCLAAWKTVSYLYCMGQFPMKMSTTTLQRSSRLKETSLRRRTFGARTSLLRTETRLVTRSLRDKRKNFKRFSQRR